jgi:hypothetical protein
MGKLHLVGFILMLVVKPSLSWIWYSLGTTLIELWLTQNIENFIRNNSTFKENKV